MHLLRGVDLDALKIGNWKCDIIWTLECCGYNPLNCSQNTRQLLKLQTNEMNETILIISYMPTVSTYIDLEQTLKIIPYAMLQTLASLWLHDRI